MICPKLPNSVKGRGESLILPDNHLFCQEITFFVKEYLNGPLVLQDTLE